MISLPASAQKAPAGDEPAGVRLAAMSPEEGKLIPFLRNRLAFRPDDREGDLASVVLRAGCGLDAFHRGEVAAAGAYGPKSRQVAPRISRQFPGSFALWKIRALSAKLKW